MPLVLNEEQTLLRDSAHAFIGESAPVTHLRKLRDTKDAKGHSPELWKKFGELGFSATLVPEASGGIGLGLVEAATIGEELGRTLAPSPFLSTAVLAARALVLGGHGPANAKLLASIAAAEVIATLAIDERSRHDPSQVDTTARNGSKENGDGWTLDGAKTFVLDGHVADWLIVSARTSPEGISLFVVDAQTAGISIERTAMVDAHNAARVRFAGVKLGTEALLGKQDQGAELLEQVLDAGRVVIAAQLLGAADAVYQRTLAYLKERKQFDRLIGSFQALQHRAATLYIDIELTRALVLKAAQAHDADPVRARATVSAAKAQAATTGNLAAREGVQMHGGMGMTDEFDMGLFMKRIRTLQELLGDASFHADRFASLNGY